ncbi:helix-turn-helix domain-containing protein [Pedobacter ginsengisoli]|uniref:helix-turn-helix domain-containing protein n=1 Tax=Pedobacter ginsengisoli TaxID=363852 RepID=UPI00254D6E5C|nr:helix-turn-helix domain-containing protein [Pedobacter ginsengisoli]
MIKSNASIHVFAPHQALQEYVQNYCYFCLGEGADQMSALDMYPVEYAQLSFVLDEYHEFRESGTNKVDSYPLCFVGLLDQGRSFDLFPKRVVQILFKPYGAFKLLGIPQRYLSNQGTDVQLLFPETVSLKEQLRDVSDSPAEVISLLENWLLKRLIASAKIDVNAIALACAEIQREGGLVRIEELCRKVGMSTTTLGEQFREKVGFSPKTFSRIVRFNNINNFISENHSVNWQELVYTFGFFDQNHFIKEFKHFYGCTPSQWHSRQNQQI